MTAAAFLRVGSTNRRSWIAAAIVRGWVTLNAATIEALFWALVVIGTFAALKAWCVDSIIWTIAYGPENVAARVWRIRPDFACPAAAVDTELAAGTRGGLWVTRNAAIVYGTDRCSPLAACICADVADITTPAYAVFSPNAQECTLSVLGAYSTASIRTADGGCSRAVTAGVIDGVTFTAETAGTLVWALGVPFTGSTLPCLWVADWLAIRAGGWVIDITTHALTIHTDGFTGAFAVCVASTA